MTDPKNGLSGVIGVLFDVFGTLVLYPNSGRTQQLAIQAQNCGLIVSDSEIGDAFSRVTIESAEKKAVNPGFSREAEAHTKVYYLWYYRRFLELLGVAYNLDGLAQRMFEEYVLLPGYCSDPQAEHLLNKLRSKGLALGVVSNGPRQVRRVLSAHGFNRFLRTTVISDEFGHEKPNAAIFRQALDNLGLSADECVYVGDVPAADMRGALNAGMAGILIDRKNKYPNPGVSCLRIRQLTELLGTLGLK